MVAFLGGIQFYDTERRTLYLTGEELRYLRTLLGAVGDDRLSELFEKFFSYILPRGDPTLAKDLGKKYLSILKDLLRRGEGDADRDTEGITSSKLARYDCYLEALSRWIVEAIPLISGSVKREEVSFTILALAKYLLFATDNLGQIDISTDSLPRCREVLNAVKDAIVVVDTQSGRIVETNESASELLGVPRDELVGREAEWIYPKEFRHVFRLKYLSGKDIYRRREILYLENKKDKVLIPAEAEYSTFYTAKGKLLVCSFRDLRDRFSAEEQFKRIQILYQTLSRMNMLMTSERNRKVFLSAAVDILFDAGFRYVGIYSKGSPIPLAEKGSFSSRTTSACIGSKEGNLFLLVGKDCCRSFLEEEVALLVEILGDINFGLRKIEVEDRVRNLEVKDSLTNLLNRQNFVKRMALEIEEAKRKSKKCALIVLDIDRFREINEAFGHEAGDQILKDLADRLIGAFGKKTLIGKIGGDEIAVLISARDLFSVLDRGLDTIKEVLSKPFKVGSYSLNLTASVGVALFPADAQTYSDLLSKAITAVQRAKELGGNKVSFFYETEGPTPIEKVTMRSELQKALERGEFLLFYQPKVSLSTGRVVGAEALIRWQREGKLVPPLKFIPLLEETSLIHDVGRWILEEATRQMREWSKKGLYIPVAVNISPIQFKIPSFVESLLNLVTKNFKEHVSLEAEITESALMEDVTLFIDILKLLKSRGVRIYIDDFGTGYSSLAYLKKLPVYSIKVDKEFIKDLPKDRENFEIVKASLSLARSFGLKTVAEGIEKEQQVGILRDLGFDFGQGYFFGKPMPPSEFERFVAGKL